MKLIYIFGILLIFFMLTHFILGETVFSAAWTNCAKYKQDCKCPAGETCLVRFGSGDDWVFKQVQGFDIPCTHNAFGLDSKRKDNDEFNCFNTSVPANQSGAPFVTVADHGKKFSLNEMALVRYGVEKKNVWAFGLLGQGLFSCDEGLLGYFPGGHGLDHKVCQVGRTYLFQNQSFGPPLADANKNFSLMQADAVYAVYFDQYIAQVAATTPLVCTASEFGLSDGLLGGTRDHSCGILTGNPVAFYNPTGFWQDVESCDDTQSCSFSITVGVTSTTTSSRSTTWQTTLSGTVNGGMTFQKEGGGGTLGGSLTASVSASVNFVQSSAYGVSASQGCSASCNVPAGQIVTLWQWQMTTTEINFDPKNLPLISDEFQTFVCNYLCLPQGQYPQCPPGYCSGDGCQSCTGPIYSN